MHNSIIQACQEDKLTSACYPTERKEKENGMSTVQYGKCWFLIGALKGKDSSKEKYSSKIGW